MAWSPDYGDPNHFVRIFCHSDGHSNGHAGFKESELGRLIDQVRNVTDALEEPQRVSV